MTDNFNSLLETTRNLLSCEWSQVEAFEDSCKLDSDILHLAGLSASHTIGTEIIGSACSTDAHEARTRAFYELLERAAIVESEANPTQVWQLLDVRQNPVELAASKDLFPPSSNERWRYAKSNGVAGGRSFAAAATAALLELIERDQVLRSWYERRAPKTLTLKDAPSINKVLTESIQNEFALQLVLFTPRDADVLVTGCFAFSHDQTRANSFGFGAATSLAAAIHKSASECVQRLAFLYDETQWNENPAVTPSPLFHQELYCHPNSAQKLNGWLHSPKSLAHCSLEFDATKTRFIDLTPTYWATDFRVVKAVNPTAVPLVFGEAWDDVYAKYFSSSSPTHRYHPIA